MIKRLKTHLKIDDSNPQHIIFLLPTCLDMETVPHLWNSCIEARNKYNPNTLSIDANKVTYCDGAGVALLLELKNQQKIANKHAEILNLDPRFEPLLSAATEQPKKPEAIKEEEKLFAENVGQFTIDTWKNTRANITFLGNLTYLMFKAITKPRSIRWKDMWFAVEDVGPKAFPIIALIGFLIGLISTFQSAEPLGRYGAQIYLINLVGLGLVREMGPLMTAVLLAGRTASSFAAEIGTMQINQEIDALKTMGLEPIQFLTIPRVIATTLMTPLLSIFLILFGLIGCSIVMHSLGYPLQTFLHQLNKAVSISDVAGGLVKATAFGAVIASVGCLHGLKTKIGASAVGEATTQAVVSSLIMIVIVDGVFAIVYYTLGI